MVAIAACTDRFYRAVIETGIPVLEIVIDSHEQYPYRFTHQQVSTIKRVLPCGDYGVRIDGSRVASVERKSLVDLVASLIGGTLRYALAELAALPRAAVVVEDRYSGIFKLDRVRPAMIADGLAELQVRWPNVPIVFCETRPWPRNGPTATSRPPTFGPAPSPPRSPASPHRYQHRASRPPLWSARGRAPPVSPSPIEVGPDPTSGTPGAQATRSSDRSRRRLPTNTLSRRVGYLPSAHRGSSGESPAHTRVGELTSQPTTVQACG